MKAKLTLLSACCLLLFFTACELTSPEEVTPDYSTSLLEPFSDMPVVEGPERLLYRPQISLISGKNTSLVTLATEGAAPLKIRSITRTRQLGSSSSSAGSNFEKSTLECGSVKSGSTEDYNFNTNDNAFYQRHGLTTNLDGNDRAYYLFVTQAQNYTFNLSGASEDLALLLFKANLTSPQENGNDIATESTTALVAFSTTHSIRREQLGPVFLEPGEYVLIVDSRPGKGSSFDLEVSCSDAAEACEGSLGAGLIAEGFDNYGFYRDISQVSSYWEDYTPGVGFPARVRSYQYMKVLNVYRLNTMIEEQEPNIIFSLGERNMGQYALEFDLGVFRGRSAYFNIQKTLTEQNANNEMGAEIFFPSNGEGYVLIENKRIDFNYRNGYWTQVKLVWDFDADSTILYIDGNRKGSWKSSAGTGGTNAIEGINFFPAFNNSFWIMDNFCFSGK